MIERYLANKRMIEAVAGTYGVDPVFVWQPVPTYKYDLDYHLFTSRGFQRHSYTKYGYPRMRERVDRGDLGGNFFWCADLQEGVREPLYVDIVHYTAVMSRNPEMEAQILAAHPMGRMGDPEADIGAVALFERVFLGWRLSQRR